MVKRTNINLDQDLVSAAAAELGTRTKTDTIHAALRDVADRAARRRAAEFFLDRMSPELLDEVRRDRDFESF